MDYYIVACVRMYKMSDHDLPVVEMSPEAAAALAAKTQEIRNIPAYNRAEYTTDPAINMAELNRWGVVVVPLFAHPAAVKSQVRNTPFPEFKDEVNTIDKAQRKIVTFQEYGKEGGQMVLKTRNLNFGMQMGGFGAYGFPSSFHDQDIRELRKTIKMGFAQYVFTNKMQQEQFNLESLFDRLCVRHANYTNIPKESWHQDLADAIDLGADDIIYGGWVNFDPNPQTFICIPGSQEIRFNKMSGFALVPDNLQAVCAGKEVALRIPSGCGIIFKQGILHRVAPFSGKANEDIRLRLFHGFRLTKTRYPLYPIEELIDWIHNGVTPKIPSGQWAEMFPKIYWGNHRARINAFCQALLKPEHTEQRTVAESTSGRNLITTVPKTEHASYVMASLRILGILDDPNLAPRFRYAPVDIAVLMPTNYAETMQGEMTEEDVLLLTEQASIRPTSLSTATKRPSSSSAAGATKKPRAAKKTVPVTKPKPTAVLPSVPLPPTERATFHMSLMEQYPAGIKFLVENEELQLDAVGRITKYNLDLLTAEDIIKEFRKRYTQDDEEAKAAGRDVYAMMKRFKIDNMEVLMDEYKYKQLHKRNATLSATPMVEDFTKVNWYEEYPAGMQFLEENKDSHFDTNFSVFHHLSTFTPDNIFDIVRRYEYNEVAAKQASNDIYAMMKRTQSPSMNVLAKRLSRYVNGKQ